MIKSSDVTLSLEEIHTNVVKNLVGAHRMIKAGVLGWAVVVRSLDLLSKKYS
jgi:hypothetical protein